MELSMALVQMKGLKCRIDDILSVTTYDEYADLRGLHVDLEDSDQLFQLKELQVIMRKLAAIGGSIEYLFRPVQETSILHRNENGEYRTEKGHYYHSGNLIEVLLQDGSHEVPCWVQTKVEYDGEDYYLAEYEEVAMEGLEVRVR